MGGDLKTDVRYTGNGDDTQVTFISNKQKYSDDNQGQSLINKYSISSEPCPIYGVSNVCSEAV